MYADDTVLYLPGPTVQSLIFYINEDLQRLPEWLGDNNLVLNVSKTKCVLQYLHLKGIKSVIAF